MIDTRIELTPCRGAALGRIVTEADDRPLAEREPDASAAELVPVLGTLRGLRVW
jgi:hypothetical protein